MFKKFLDLGSQSLANSYLLKNNYLKKKITCKIKVGVNLKNYLVSIQNTVPKVKMFNAKYPYRSSISLTMSGYRKDVISRIHDGGTRDRKKKLLEKQKKEKLK
jgi:translation elongation factor EF-4